MKKKINSTIIMIIAVILLIVGSIIFLYPTISNYIAEKNQGKVIEQYEEQIHSNESNINTKKELEKAKIYNENLAGDPVHDPFVKGSGYALPDNYLEVLNINNNIMGYITIPKISLKLPIYHGTSSEVLEKGIGHIETTALPIGGTSRHSVLTGHRGLPTARLFSDLDKLEIGDYIYINILDEILTYEVYDLEVIEPTEIEHLRPIKNRDLITLVTCTPYGINTHRLLVHTERVNDTKKIDYKEIEEAENIAPKLETKKILIIALTIIIVVTITLVNIILKRRKK